MKSQFRKIIYIQYKFADSINRLAEKIMSNFQDELAYISENYEGEIGEILSD